MSLEPGESINSTSASADAFLRRGALWSQLLEIFRTQTPSDAQLAQVSTLAEVAIDRVFSAHHLTADECRRQHGAVKDYAECAALYGYVLGFAAATAYQQERKTA